MSWNKCLYQYHKKYGGTYVGGQRDGGLLILTFKDRPLVVVPHTEAGRYGTIPYPQARIPVSLTKPYKLSIGAETRLSGGVNAVIKAASSVPGLAGMSNPPADFGFPEVTKKRRIRSDNYPFTKLVLGSLDLRNALLACPKEKVEICPEAEEGLYTILVTSTVSMEDSAPPGNPDDGWFLGVDNGFPEIYASQEEKAQLAQRVETEFFPRMDRFLDLARAAYSAVTQWPM